ncbi:cystatin-like [Protopterus annectens]|uniref:cystatin-like n=1 Tax=Protopterus annectens TaxID=7888 RepID=UPI001CFB5D3B|nr:cystatin-like [Protopterus annectens]
MVIVCKVIVLSVLFFSTADLFPIDEWSYSNNDGNQFEPDSAVTVIPQTTLIFYDTYEDIYGDIFIFGEPADMTSEDVKEKADFAVHEYGAVSSDSCTYTLAKINSAVKQEVEAVRYGLDVDVKQICKEDEQVVTCKFEVIADNYYYNDSLAKHSCAKSN